MEKCSSIQCTNKNCLLMHPRACKFFASSGKCKFGDGCAFHHTPPAIADVEIARLEDVLKSIISKLEEIEGKIKALEESDKKVWD